MFLSYISMCVWRPQRSAHLGRIMTKRLYTKVCFLKYKRIFLQTIEPLLLCGRVSDMFVQGSFTFLTKIITHVGGYEQNGVNRRRWGKRSEQLLRGKEGRRLVFVTLLHTSYLIYDASSSILDSFISALLLVCQ